MFKLMVIFHSPTDIDHFEASYNQFLGKVEQMPGVIRRQVVDVMGSPTGQSPYYRILEVYFDNRQRMELSLRAPIGQDAGNQLRTFPAGSFEMLFAEVYEEAGNWPSENNIGEM
jgi:uncharacterized protein (TIGR02118 family)